MWKLRAVDSDPTVPLVFRLLAGHMRTIGRTSGANFIVDAPLISRVHEHLYFGAIDPSVDLGVTFDHIISLYPFERYAFTNAQTFIEVQMDDVARIPDEEQLAMLALWVNQCRRSGPTLVHC